MADIEYTTPENWLPVVGYEGLYEVSNHGRIRSLDRIVLDQFGIRRRHRKGKILKLSFDKSKIDTNKTYMQAALFLDGKVSRHQVSRIVLESFMGPPPTKKHEANHKNGNKIDNRLENLEWVTTSENIKHAYRVLGKKPCGNIIPGADNPFSKSVDVDHIFSLRASGLSMRKICSITGIGYGTINGILNFTNWRAQGFQ